MSKVKIAIVEDHGMFREGIRSLLTQVADFEIVGEYANGQLFLDDLDRISSDVVLLDIEMPVMNGIETARRLAELKCSARILVLSMYSSRHYFQEMISLGACGFVLKESSVHILEEAIREVIADRLYFAGELAFRMLSDARQTNESNIAVRQNDVFSPRQKEILHFVCQGLTNSDIAHRLSLSIKTVESNKTQMMRHVGVINNAGLIIYAVKHNLITF